MSIILSIFVFIALVDQGKLEIKALSLNKSIHRRRDKSDEKYFNNEKLPAYRSFQPVSIKYHKASYPSVDRTDDYITSYEADYGGVVSNFTSSIYENDDPPLYPNPNNFVDIKATNNENEVPELEVDVPDDSLADGDLKEHNIIDSVTYLYGFNNCHGVRSEWIMLIYISGGIACCLLSFTTLWLFLSDYAAEFRTTSKLYPVNMNLLCCLLACNLLYLHAVIGTSSPSRCEIIALLLHYSHAVCAVWIVLLAWGMTQYSVSGAVPSLKYNYLIAYGVPAVMVMFNFALSMEHYEIKHYCWMSIEKGMVIGFMIPAMVLILVNTLFVIIGLQGVNMKQDEIMTAKLQELIDHWPDAEPLDEDWQKNDFDIYTPSSSRKNTDSSDSPDKEYNFNEDDTHVNIEVNEELQNDHPKENPQSYKNLLTILYMDNLSWKSLWNGEASELKVYLNLCLVLEPFYAVNWVMGVVALENTGHWSTPTIFLLLVTAMYVYLAVQLSTTLPILKAPPEVAPCCGEIIMEPNVTKTRTTDSIPLLDPSVQQPAVTSAPADTISTISI